MKKLFDYIIIGSSPMLLLKAIDLRKKGFTVLVLEQNKELGGSWRYFVYDNKKYEGACHLLDGSWKMRNLLLNFGIQMERIHYSPGLVCKNQIYLLSDFTSRFKLAYIQSTQIKSFVKRIFLFLKAIAKSFKPVVYGYYYFKGGSPFSLIINRAMLD